MQVVLEHPGGRRAGAGPYQSPSLRELLRRSDPGSVEAFSFYRSTGLHPWQTDRVAVIGDAAHPIPPTAGIGASIAIADTGDLAAAICSGQGDPRVAIRDTQPHMLRRAAAAARSSRRVLTARTLLRREWLRQLALLVVLPLLDTATDAYLRYRHRTSDPRS